MSKSKFFATLSTLGKIGYFPAPGTMATLATLPIVYLISHLEIQFWGQLLIIVCATTISYFIIKKALPYFCQIYTQCFIVDPSEIVLDEFVGCLFTFFAIPINFGTIFAGVILFRFFDILKPLGIKRAERIGGAKGIIFDDIIAGIISNILLRILLFYF